MVWHGQTAAGVGQTATGVAAAAAAPTTTGVARPATGVAAAAAAPTATGVARPAPATEEELLTSGWPCDWAPTAAAKAGAHSKATAWYARLQLQGDTLIQRLPPRVPPKAATGVAAKAATGVAAWLPPARKAATRHRKFKALSRMTHMQAIQDIRYFTKVFKAYLKHIKEMRPQHWDTLGYKVNVKQWRAVVAARRRRAEVASSATRSKTKVD